MKAVLFSMLFVLCCWSTMHAQQPYAGCWHPEFIKDWTPEKDPDRKFNKSSIPLQPRIAGETQKANPHQFPDGQVAACLTMHPMCSQVPSQGANNFIGYNPSYWQYLDVLVWWGGSAGEGIILPPSAPVIDIAHLNGVKVLGQIFFPTPTHSGNPEWTYQMNTRNPDGTYPYARKCVEIAEYYGFDGWFLNSETITSTNWGGWTKDYLKYAKERGLEGQEIQLYVMSSGTSGSYIEDVAMQKGGSYMVNYGGANYASNVINRMTSHVTNGWGDREDAFKTWYYGVEQSGSISGNGSSFNILFPEKGHNGSINFFNPEEPIWKKVVKDLLNTPNACGPQAYDAMKSVFKNEQLFWVNPSGNVTITRPNPMGMMGLATAILERSAIQSKPFITTFSMGLGKHRFVNGEKRGTQDWYNRGMQTIMPTWRWWQTQGMASPTTAFSFDYNWDDAYNMGTSIDVKGKLTNSTDYVLRLYKVNLKIEAGDKLQFVYKTNSPGSITVKLADKTNPLAVKAIGTPVSVTENGWTVDTYDLSALAGGQEIVAIALNINAANGSGFTARLGQLAVYPANYAPADAQVRNLEVQNKLGESIAELRVVWDRPASKDVHHFNVYLEREGVTSLVGQTRNEGFYIPKFERKGQGEKSVKVTVKAVNKNMVEAANGVSKEMFFPNITLPVVSVTASKTIVKVGEEITVTAKASNFPEEFTWKSSENMTLVSSNKNTAVYKFGAGGLYDIAVDVRNAVGTTSFKEEKMIKVTAAGSDDLKLVSLSKSPFNTKIRESGHIGIEASSNLIDGVRIPSSTANKWCSSGKDGEMWVILDLNKVYELYRFQMFDCGHKENASDNLTHYRIYTSLTGNENDWTLVVDAKDIPATAEYNTKNDYIKPTLGRFVKFVPYNPDMAITIRIWEFEVYGIDAAIPPVIQSITADKKTVKTNEEVKFTVSAVGSPTRYEWTVKGGTKVSESGNTAVYKFAKEGSYSVTVKAVNDLGEDSRTENNLVEVTNTRIQANIPLVITSGFNMDVLIEGTPADEYGQKIDDEGWAFGVAGSVVPESGVIPVFMDHLLISSRGVPFKLGAYDKNNAIQLKGLASATIEVEGKYAAERLYFLATGVQGPSRALDITVNYTDGSSSPATRFSLNDWCDPSASAVSAIGTINRLFVLKGSSYQFELVETPAKAKMYEFEMPLDLTKRIKSITASNGTSGVYPTLFAFTAHAHLDVATIEAPEDVTIKPGETKEINASFSLLADKEPDFAIMVNAEDFTVATISDVISNTNEGKVRFNVKGLKEGETDVVISLQNGDIKDLQARFKVKVTSTTSINHTDAVEVNLWPNPVQQGAVLNIQAATDQTVRLLSLQGVVLLKEEVKQGITQIPLSSLSAGAYIVELAGENGTKIQKLIVRQ